MATKEITKQQPRFVDPDLEQELVIEAEESGTARRRMIGRVAVLWEKRQFIFRCGAIGFLCSTVLVFLIPVRYTSTTRLMPPDQSGQGIASMLAVVAKATGDSGLGGISGMKTTGDLFIGVMQSRRVQDDLVNKFDLRKLYGVKRQDDARNILHGSTEVTAD